MGALKIIVAAAALGMSAVVATGASAADRGYGGGGYDRYDNYRGPHGGSRIVNRMSFDTRYRAHIVLVEEMHYRGRHRELTCTVSVRGPQARYVPRGQVRSVAARHCSRGAKLRLYA